MTARRQPLLAAAALTGALALTGCVPGLSGAKPVGATVRPSAPQTLTPAGPTQREEQDLARRTAASRARTSAGTPAPKPTPKTKAKTEAPAKTKAQPSGRPAPKVNPAPTSIKPKATTQTAPKPAPKPSPKPAPKPKPKPKPKPTTTYPYLSADGCWIVHADRRHPANPAPASCGFDDPDNFDGPIVTVP